MTISPGTGSSIGTSSTPYPREIETSAATVVARMLMGMVPDTIQRPFSQIDVDAAWKYKSSANNPTIPPLSQLRVAMTSLREADKTWAEQFNILLNLLPEDVRNELFLQASLPQEEQDPAYLALDAALGDASQFLVAINKMTKPLDTAAPDRIADFQNMPLETLENAFLQGNVILSSLLNAVNAMGHNDFHFDALSRFTAEIDDRFQELAKLTSQQPLNQDALSQLAKDFDKIGNQLGTAGDQLQILKPIADMLSSISGAFSVNPGSTPLLLGLDIASIGLHDPNTGIFPNRISSLITQLSDNIAVNLLASSSTGEKKLFSSLVDLLTLSAAALPAVLSNDTMRTTLNLRMLIDSGILSTACTTLALCCGANEKNAATISDILSLSVATLALQTVSAGNSEILEQLISDIKQPLSTWLEHTSDYLSLFLLDHPNSDTSTLLVSIQKARIALDLSEHRVVAQVMDDIFYLKQLDKHSASRMDELKQLNQFFANIKNILNPQEEFIPQTGIVLG